VSIGVREPATGKAHLVQGRSSILLGQRTDSMTLAIGTRSSVGVSDAVLRLVKPRFSPEGRCGRVLACC